ncbi:hypothetical protein OHB12_16320 [Nocardia sp. NBC_01730]|uniref:hypothetical protein n=1 Tax=Nocardia sp. NBC_01730 TaxID=2975998 RepID=UPI002E0D67BB|nr:hypothetical protein OHB12_16320 [Nocardia sp. NBC_01730]
MNVMASPVFSILVLVAGSSVLSAVVTTLANRKSIDANTTKTKADAAKTLSDTAIAQSQQMAGQIGELRQALRVHREWDKKMVLKARQAGLDFDEPPELWL